MKMKLLLLILLIGLAVFANSQNTNGKTFKIGPGIVVGLPAGDMTTSWSLAYGVDLQAEYASSSLAELTLSVGFVDWAPKSEYKGGNSSSLPVLAGIKYYSSNKIFVSAQLGISFLTESGAGSYFTFAPGIGYKISENFNLLLKYQAVRMKGFGVDFVGVRAGVSF